MPRFYHLSSNLYDIQLFNEKNNNFVRYEIHYAINE